MNSIKFKFRHLNRKRINASRSALLKTIIFFFDTPKNKTESFNNSPILVLRSDGKIGDSIVASGFFRELRRLSPHSKIIVLGSPQVQSVYKNSKYIDELLIYKKGFLNTLRIFLKLRVNNFKFILNSTDEVKPHAAFLQGQLKASHKLIFSSNTLKSTTHVINFLEGQKHFTGLYENTLGLMYPGERVDVSYELSICPAVLDRVQKKIDARVLRNVKIIAFNAFAGTKFRSFSFETSINIIRTLLAESDAVVLSVGSPKDIQVIKEWKRRAQAIVPREMLERWIYIEDLKTLEEGFAQVQCADLLISPDTSLIHAACALNKKLIGVYRQRGDYQHSAVWGPMMGDASRFRVVQAVSGVGEYWDVNLVRMEDFFGAYQEIF